MSIREQRRSLVAGPHLLDPFALFRICCSGIFRRMGIPWLFAVQKERMLYFGWAVRSKADMLPATDRAERRNVILMVRSVKLKKSTSG